MSGTEQRGVCAGGKKPTARSIKQDFETFLKVSKSAQRGENTFSTRWAAERLLYFLTKYTPMGIIYIYPLPYEREGQS